MKLDVHRDAVKVFEVAKWAVPSVVVAGASLRALLQTSGTFVPNRDDFK